MRIKHPVTFIELAHGIRDVWGRKGMSLAKRKSNYEKGVVFAANLHKSIEAAKAEEAAKEAQEAKAKEENTPP